MARRFRRLSPPPLRNLLIYHELVYENLRQVEVAERYQIAQCRVSQIGRRVALWVEEVLSGERKSRRDAAGLRLHLAIAKERIRLHEAHDPLLQLCGGDEDPEGVRYIRRSVNLVGGQPVTTVEIFDGPDAKLFEQALHVSQRLVELEEVANRGPLADLPARYFEQKQRFQSGEPASNTSKTTSNAPEILGRGVLFPPPPAPNSPVLSSEAAPLCGAAASPA